MNIDAYIYVYYLLVLRHEITYFNFVESKTDSDDLSIPTCDMNERIKRIRERCSLMKDELGSKMPRVRYM